MNRIYYLFIIFQIIYAESTTYEDEIRELINNLNYLDAMSQIESTIEKKPNSSQIYALASEVSLKLDRLEDSNKFMKLAIENDPENDTFRSEWEKIEQLNLSLKSAKKTFDSGYVDESINEYIELISNYPNQGIIHYTLGLIYKSIDDYNLAINQYKLAVKSNPFEEKYKKAILVISQTMAKEGDTEYRRREYQSAINYYKQAIEYSPTYSVALFKLARTYYKAGDLVNASIYLDKNIQIDYNQEQSHKMLGDIARKNGNLEKAIDSYNNAVNINNNYSKAYYSLGSTLIKKGDNESARLALNTATKLDSTYSKAFGALGLVEQNLENYESAILNYKKAVIIDPKGYDFYYRLASVLNITNDYEEAKISAKESINIKRNYAPAFYELGVAEKALGNKVAAISAFEKAQKDKNWRKLATFEIDLLNKGL